MANLVLGIVLGLVTYFVMSAQLGMVWGVVLGIVVLFLEAGGLTYIERARK